MPNQSNPKVNCGPALKKENSHTKEKAISLIENQTIKSAEKTLFEYFTQLEMKEKTLIKRDSVNTQRVSVTLSDKSISNLSQLKALTKNYNDNEIIEQALEKMIKSITKTNKNFSKSNSKNARFIPASIKQEAKIRANFTCEHAKCDEIHFLEIHHKKPIAKGGKSQIENLQILCSAHHQFLHRH